MRTKTERKKPIARSEWESTARHGMAFGVVLCGKALNFLAVFGLWSRCRNAHYLANGTNQTFKPNKTNRHTHAFLTLCCCCCCCPKSWCTTQQIEIILIPINRKDETRWSVRRTVNYFPLCIMCCGWWWCCYTFLRCIDNGVCISSISLFGCDFYCARCINVCVCDDSLLCAQAIGCCCFI